MKQVKGKTVWMHCASLGEYEQGKPVLENILKMHPDITPVISFFSPSGYEIIKKKNAFPYVYYLPMDSIVNAQLWLKQVNPSLILWVKYEYWYFFLKAIERKKIPLIMISGIYQRSQIFFRWYGGLYRKMLQSFTHFFVQNENSGRYLSVLVDKDKITLSGDTRCDRVIDIARDFKPIESIEKFTGDKKVVVCGSTWEADEAIWVHYVNTHPEMRFIIAPHEIHKDNINHIKGQFKNSVAFSDWAGKTGNISESRADFNCLIIDNIGMLSRLYYYADITYVGGGFGDRGLHNILEAAVYGKPVIFGPVIYKNFEASELIEAKGGVSVKTAIELEKYVDELFSDADLLKITGEAASQYVLKSSGATQIISEFLNNNRLL